MILEPLSMELQRLTGDVRQPLPGCFGPKMEHFLHSTFPRLFEEQAAIHPHRAAIIAGRNRLSYAELNARANQLARHLRARGARRETLVGICIDRSLEMAVGILAILKSGAGYLPIDPDYPRERLKWMLENSGVSLVVTQQRLVAQLSSCGARLIALEADRELICQQTEGNLHNGPKADNLAYVIYTSGSTGEPKGVTITHASLANYVLALQHELQIDHNDRYLHTASISFSSSRRQLLLPLSQGAAVVIASAEQRKDPLALFQMIKRENVTVMDAVPSFWRSCTAMLETLGDETRAQLLDNGLRLMLSASEPLLSDIPRTWLNKFAHRARHFHMFGQTETAGIVCLHEVPNDNELSGDIAVVPVGRPIANTEIYILDEQQQPVAAGTTGELYIGGAGLGRGYLRRPGLTAAKFIPHPFSETPGAQLYRTGDWARWRADGAIEFAGRQDSQVKVRGFRVELQEIELVLARHPAVKNNVVVMKNDGGAKRLVAYFVANSSTSSVAELRNFLTERLPDYMVPSVFVQLKALPLNANGKVNRRALPELPEKRPELTIPYRTPETSTEKTLASIWSTVLKIDQPGLDDDFFELGGHSLLAMQVMARINQQLKVTLPLRVLFDGPTIRQLAKKIAATELHEDSTAQTIQAICRTRESPLSFAQQRLWFLDQLEPDSPLYNINRAVRLSGPLDLAKLEGAVQSIAARHEALRTTFVEVDGLPVQRVAPTTVLPFQLRDLRSVPATVREKELQRLLTLEAERPFDMTCGPLARVNVLRLAAEEHVLLLSIHHAVADAWSISLFFSELASFYLNEESQLPALRVQYADFAEWQRARLNGGALSAQLAYWKQQLANAPLVLDLPTDRLRPLMLSSHGARQAISLVQDLRQALKDVSREEGVTLFTLLMAAFQVLLARYSGQDDILVGTPVAGRTLVDTETLIGCFINTLVLRGDLSGNPSLREVIKRTREQALGAFTNQDVPFEKLVEELRPNRTLSRSPIFQVMFVLQDETKPDLMLPGIRVTPLEFDSTTAKFELALGVVEKAESMDVWLSYSTDLYEPASIAAILDDFTQVLKVIVSDCGQQLSDLPAVSWVTQTPRAEECFRTSIQDEQGTAAADFVAPRTPVEERLADIWSEVLQVEKVSVHENFFELGGHSLLAAQVIARARNVFSAALTLHRIFETPTIAGLAEAIYEIETSETEDDELAAMLAELNQLSEEEAQQRVANERV
ncbi:MAG TPA: amino acid adenylation domain-containing protein [Pyrinomonadaceae bacterium]|nr:amino acid adenylation domain-containing protein [Pyrinomonadaceae bacterium]